MKKLYDLRANLMPFIPEKSLDEVVILLQKYPIHLGLMAPRSRVFGDYRAPQRNGEFHKITVNGDLNKYAFLITLLHEYAHLLVFVEHGPRAQSHGNEWKSAFRQLLRRLIQLEIFPEDIGLALQNYMIKTPASTATDPRLMRVLERYNTRKRPENEITVEQLPPRARFKYNGDFFEKGERLRKNYTCIRLSDGAKFRFSPVAKVAL
ncbi:MAG: SprT-like domain-containing protein [Bacteroidales bacterium]|nr:SprT-like domain-containing protein [Bacteroidales bacterium]